MELSEMLKKLKMSLNSIEVRGEANLDLLLGCIMATDRMIAMLNEQKEENEDGRQTDI